MNAVPGNRFSVPMLLTTVGTCAALLVATDLVLGLPDMSLVGAFTSGTRPSHEAALATSSLLVWTALLAVCTWMIVCSCRGLPKAARRSARRAVDPGTVVMVIGVCLLAIAVARHAAPSPPMCCGSIKEASQSLGQ